MSVKTSRPYKVGIALSGGGARGFAHAGALLALEEAGIKPDIIAGVSAGSIVGALYASGMKPENILNIFDGVKFNDLCELSVPKDGFFKLDRFKRFLRKYLSTEFIEDLQLPTLICATDLDNGVPIAFGDGNIVNAIVASCSIPIVFKPVKINGNYYVDGGVLHNLPAWSIRDKCELLIGVNCSPLVNSKMKHTVIDVALRSFDLLARTNAISDMALCDIVVETKDIAQHKVFDLKERTKVYKSGYAITRQVLEENGVLLEKLKKMNNHE